MTIDSNGLKIRIIIRHAARPEMFRAIYAKCYYRVDGFIIVFDVTNAKSFSSLSNWVNDIEKNAPERSAAILVGNKSDLELDREVSFDEAKKFADSRGLNYIEVSAKTGRNFQKLFEFLIREIIYKIA